jgi:hypothetical protein
LFGIRPTPVRQKRVLRCCEIFLRRHPKCSYDLLYAVAAGPEPSSSGDGWGATTVALFGAVRRSVPQPRLRGSGQLTTSQATLFVLDNLGVSFRCRVVGLLMITLYLSERALGELDSDGRAAEADNGNANKESQRVCAGD